ncbi:MAG: HipA domain-containing protein [Tetrasphaera sp.]
MTLGGRIVGHLRQRGDHTWLEWQDGYWDDPNRPVLGLRFEDQPRARVSSALRLPPWFSNLLPEGLQREWVARDAGVKPDREMMLLRRLGNDLPGAIMIEAVTGPVSPDWEPDQVIPEPARRPSPPGSEHRFSLAGVALKFSMLQAGDRLTIPSTDGAGDWIAKMPDAAHQGLPGNEFTMMTMAKAVDITTPDVKLVRRDELPDLPSAAWPARQGTAYAIKRFDRTDFGRIHIEDLAQVRGFYPEEKYAGSFETAAALVYRRHDLSSYLQFVRRLFFSYAIGNGDMHLKNTSLMYADPRRPTISPAYDLVCTAPYLSGPEDLGLKLGRSRRFDTVSPESFRHLAERVGAPKGQTLATVRETAGLLEAAWDSARSVMAPLPGHTAYLDERLLEIAHRFR